MSIEKDLTVCSFLDDFFSDRRVAGEIENRVKAARKSYQLERGVVLGEDSGFNLGKEIEYVCATAIRKLFGKRVMLKDELPKKEKEKYGSFVDLIIDDNITLSLKSKMTNRKNAATLMVQQNYEHLLSLPMSKDELREHIRNLDDLEFESHYVLYVTHGLDEIVVECFRVTRDDLTMSGVTVAQHVRKEYSISSSVRNKKIRESGYRMKVYVDEGECSSQAYKEYIADKHRKGKKLQNAEELFV